MTPRRSHHLIGLFRGQFGDIPEAEWLDFLSSAGFDGQEAAGALGKLQGRRVPVTAFVGSPVLCWSHCFEFPPRPARSAAARVPTCST